MRRKRKSIDEILHCITKLLENIPQNSSESLPMSISDFSKVLGISPATVERWLGIIIHIQGLPRIEMHANPLSGKPYYIIYTKKEEREEERTEESPIPRKSSQVQAV